MTEIATETVETTTTTLVTPTPTLTRSFESEIVEMDGRTIEARIVPYNVTTIVADPPDFRPYPEMFMPGAFERQLRAPDRVRVWLNFEHEQGLRGIVGHGAQLEDRDDALYGHFRVHPNADGDKALQLVEEKLLTGLSIEFDALRSQRIDGVMRRLRARIDKVSLCRFPAYESAQVLAVREQLASDESDEIDEETTLVERLRAEKLEPIPFADDLVARLRSLNVEPLARIATSSASWDGSASRFTDEQYERSTLFCRPGDAPIKERCSLPVLEPSGALNTNALGAAAAALAGARGGLSDVSRAQKAAAARKLIRYYNAAKMEPPASLVALARSA